MTAEARTVGPSDRRTVHDQKQFREPLLTSSKGRRQVACPRGADTPGEGYHTPPRHEYKDITEDTLTTTHHHLHNTYSSNAKQEPFLSEHVAGSNGVKGERINEPTPHYDTHTHTPPQSLRMKTVVAAAHAHSPCQLQQRPSDIANKTMRIRRRARAPPPPPRCIAAICTTASGGRSSHSNSDNKYCTPPRHYPVDARPISDPKP
ncbi:unnamed protein product [Danaus chrysippus]|uniref:(African queen) hypothetical protein n=1 Tax=Danaus chrysippus TaxID=151541 RepID=A0A8J2R6Y3_9NEOP|nr:unnamed protein product [Danaus chrysippus]